MVNTLKKIITIGLIFGCNSANFSNAEFTNLKPAVIKMDNLTYVMTDEIVTTNEVEDQIGEFKSTQLFLIQKTETLIKLQAKFLK